MRGALVSSTRWQQALVVWCAMIVLGSSGCMLDTKPLHSTTEGPATRAHTSAESHDAALASDPQSDSAVATGTGTACSDDAGSCGARCRVDGDCTAPKPCHTAVCIEGLCHEEAVFDASQCDEDAGSNMCPAGHCDTCAAGASQCVDQKLRSCGADGRWSQPKACEHGCSGNACNECTPGSTQCSSAHDAQSCGADGRWEAREACESGCANGHCKMCTHGAKRCSDSRQETCSTDGMWQATACSLGCAGDHCAACKVGSRECTGSDMNDARVCDDNGEWGASMTCPSSCIDGQCSDCSPGAQRCAGPGVQLCGLDRRWQTIESCPNGCDGMSCAACKEGALECPSRTTVRVCRNHMWSEPDNCRPNAHCSTDAPMGNMCPCDPGYIDPHPNPGLCMTGP